MQLDESVFDRTMETVFSVSDQELKKRLWRALCRDAKACRWRFLFRKAYEQRLDVHQVRRQLFQRVTCWDLIGWLERSVVRGDLHRHEVRALEERILDLVDAAGNWR